MKTLTAAPSRLLIALALCAACTAAYADTYQYDERGDLETLTTPRGVRTYQYDEVQRLKMEQGYTGSRNHAYDANGNRTTDAASAPGTPTAATYTASTNRVATINGAAVTIDAAGQITNDGLNTYTWDDAGRLKTVSRAGQLRATYYYDHKHRRTRKVTTAAALQGAKTLFFHYDDQDRLIAETTETGAPIRSYLWADATLLAQIEYTLNATTGLYTVLRELLFELDHLGTPRQARLNTGTAVWRWESDGYGNTLPNEDPDGNGQLTTVNLRFPGQYHDEESGLHYNWHRYYVPRLGRYLSSDPIGVAGGTNAYAYVAGNPISFTDPTGLACNSSGCWLTPNENGLVAAGNYSGYYAAACSGGDVYACAASRIASNQGLAANFTNWRLRNSLKRNRASESQCDAKMESIRVDLARAHADTLRGGAPQRPVVLTASQISAFHNNVFSLHGAGAVFGGDIPGSDFFFSWCSLPSCRP